MQFSFEVRLPRVRFGRGAGALLHEELSRLGIAAPLVLSTPGREQLARRLAETVRPAAFSATAVMHTPVPVSEQASEAALASGADGLVAIGGGSTINLAKAVALRTGLPIVAMPTTYAGSEMTEILGQTEGGAKRTLRDPKVLPRTILYDPDLLDGLAPAVAGPSGLNALAHAAEALYASEANPIIDHLAVEAIAALAGSLPAIVDGQSGSEPGDRALYGAWLAGACLGAAGMGLHHKICHTLGGSFGLPHAETHAVMLPYTMLYNAPAAPAAMARISEALGGGDAPAALHRLMRRICSATSLMDLGLLESDLDRASELAVRAPYPNPRPLDGDLIRRMLGQAWAGTSPETL